MGRKQVVVVSVVIFEIYIFKSREGGLLKQTSVMSYYQEYCHFRSNHDALGEKNSVCTSGYRTVP